MGAAWGGAELIEGWGVKGRGRKWAGLGTGLKQKWAGLGKGRSL